MFAESNASDLFRKFMGNEPSCSTNQMARKPMNVNKINYSEIYIWNFEIKVFILVTASITQLQLVWFVSIFFCSLYSVVFITGKISVWPMVELAVRVGSVKLIIRVN